MKIRHVLILVVGLALATITWKNKYQSNPLSALLWLGLMIFAFVITAVSLWLDIKDYRRQKHISNFMASFMILGFGIIIGCSEYIIHSEFNKPSRLKAYYDGDFNGLSLDFKKNGTYIIENSTIGFNDYQYGTYILSGDTIRLNNTGVMESSLSPYLAIKTDDETGEKHLYQTDSKGNILASETSFRVISESK